MDNIGQLAGDAGGASGVPPEHERKLRTSLLTVGEATQYTTKDATQISLEGEQLNDSKVEANRQITK